MLQDFAHGQPSSATGCHILSSHEQNAPAATVTMAGTGCFGISKMFMGAAVANPAITAFSITSNVVTFTAANSMFPGQTFIPSGLSVGTYLNGQQLYVISATGTQVTAAFPSGNVGSTSDSGSLNPYAASCGAYQKGAAAAPSLRLSQPPGFRLGSPPLRRVFRPQAMPALPPLTRPVGRSAITSRWCPTRYRVEQAFN